MKPIRRQKWQNLARKRVQSGLYARSSAVTLRGEAILPSFGFGRFGHPPRRERLENEPHFLRFRFSQLIKTIQTKLTSFMGPYPGLHLALQAYVKSSDLRRQTAHGKTNERKTLTVDCKSKARRTPPAPPDALLDKTRAGVRFVRPT
nr:hypothetical protein [uncultured Roseibium sp.]